MISGMPRAWQTSASPATSAATPVSVGLTASIARTSGCASSVARSASGVTVWESASSSS